MNSNMKLNVRAYVQDINETAFDFAKRIETISDDLCKEYNPMGGMACFPTSSSNGRMTVILQFYTERKINSNEPLFSMIHIQKAFERFIKINPKADELILTKDLKSFLIEQKLSEYEQIDN